MEAVSYIEMGREHRERVQGPALTRPGDAELISEPSQRHLKSKHKPRALGVTQCSRRGCGPGAGRQFLQDWQFNTPALAGPSLITWKKGHMVSSRKCQGVIPAPAPRVPDCLSNPTAQLCLPSRCPSHPEGNNSQTSCSCSLNTSLECFLMAAP